MYSSVTERAQVLLERQKLKMAGSPHAYVRGNTSKFYGWLLSLNHGSIPEGPPVWICGDCHSGNLGPIADNNGNIAVQIRDLDQTVIGNPAFDLIRLGLSLATAARGSNLPGVTTARMLEHLMLGYEQAFHLNDKLSDSVIRPKSIKIATTDALKRKWRDLARERIEDEQPKIPLGKNFWPLLNNERIEIERIFANADPKALSALLRCTEHPKLRILDAAFWVKGCSSLGRMRFAVLVQVKSDRKKYCLIDIKEAVGTHAPADPRAHMPRSNGERVVQGARQLAPYLGERMMSATFLEHSVFLRELLPQDMKVEFDHLKCKEAVKVAQYLSNVVGKAHAHQMDQSTRENWLRELQRARSRTLDAPSWLWASIVELIVTHEAAYLEHCRKFARLSKK